MVNERYKHLILSDLPRTLPFTNPRHGGQTPRVPPGRDRIGHGNYLMQQLQKAWEQADQYRQRAVVQVERSGAYFEFVGEPGFDLSVISLEHLRSGIRLLNIRKEGEGENERALATVFVPFDQRGYFLQKIQAYANEDNARTGKPKNAKLVESISDIRNAVLNSFWRTSERDLVPDKVPEWVEAWLSSDQEATIGRFKELLRAQGIDSAEGVLRFPERAVMLIKANRVDLEKIIESSDALAEYRATKRITSFVIQAENQDQLRHVQDLLRRAKFGGTGDVAVCILDGGINNGHLLLQPILAGTDLQTVDQAWGVSDDDGHGTLMAGTVAYGDLLAILNGSGSTQIDYRLESVKILPPPPAQNLKEFWGYRTAQGISRAEIQAPQRKRIVCMAVTAMETRERGRPSSWSGTIDALASGYEDDSHRLVIISAGNVDDQSNWLNYPHDNLTNEVHDPGQAWNALTVGAFTEKVQLLDPTMVGYSPIANAGGLSPYSTTSTTWQLRKWPIKPEVVFEGGNVARGPNSSIFPHDNLQLISTYYDPQVAQFDIFNATSASSAQAARMAAQIQVLYPNAWPETIRALLIHNADWTDEMRSQFLPSTAPTRQDYARLLRICGYGVPNIEHALYCASNSLTLISQAELQPFDKRDTQYVTRDMHLYNLPWPTDVLSSLGETEVSMRVTLSYFVEPGPGEVGWDDRYRYASHALRFEVNGPGESADDFVRRVNVQARDDGRHPGTAGPGDRWVIGDARNVGSIHSDIWQGQAAELAASNNIAVYPTVGWWRERHHLERWDKRCRYSLVVSIHTPEQSANIYVPVAQAIHVTPPVEIPIRPAARK